MPGHSAQGPVSPCPCRYLYFCVLVAAVPVSEVVSRCRFDSHSLGTGGVEHLSVGSLAQAARAPPQPGDSHSHQHALRFTSLDVGLWVRIPRTPRAHASLASEVEAGVRLGDPWPVLCLPPGHSALPFTKPLALPGSGGSWARPPTCPHTCGRPTCRPHLLPGVSPAQPPRRARRGHPAPHETVSGRPLDVQNGSGNPAHLLSSS